MLLQGTKHTIYVWKLTDETFCPFTKYFYQDFPQLSLKKMLKQLLSIDCTFMVHFVEAVWAYFQFHFLYPLYQVVFYWHYFLCWFLLRCSPAIGQLQGGGFARPSAKSVIILTLYVHISSLKKQKFYDVSFVKYYGIMKSCLTIYTHSHRHSLLQHLINRYDLTSIHCMNEAFNKFQIGF